MSRLFDIFGDFTDAWPSRDISGEAGVGPVPDVTSWLGSLNSGVELVDVRTGVEGDRSTLEATVHLSNAPLSAGTGYADGFPLVFFDMPDVEIKLLDSTEIQLFVAVSPRGAEVVVENLDVEIFLPAGLLEPPEDETSPGGIERPELGVGEEAEVTVFYRRGSKSSYLTKLRIHIDENLNVSLITPRPISFEKCVFSGLAVHAIHDFVLIPSPAIAENHQSWLRHSIVPFIEEAQIQGMFAIRSVDLDISGTPFKELTEWLNERSENDPQAEFVLDDLVVPFYSLYVLPIPRHVTLGIRKLFERADQLKDVAEHFDFRRAPVVAYFNRSPLVALIVRSLFYRTLPSETIDEDLGLTFSAGIAIGGDEPNEERLENPEEGDGEGGAGAEDSPMEPGAHVITFGLGEQYTIFAGYQLPEAFKLIELGGLAIYFLGFKLGYSIGRHMELSKDGADGGEIFGKSIYATLDLILTKDEDSGDSRLLSLRSVNSDKVKVIFEGIGYDRGEFTVGDNVSMPDGVAIWIVDTVAIVIEELGILSEDGAAYFSFSGGVLWDTSGFDGGITFKRMRFRMSGNPSAPPFKMDGFFIRLESESVKIEAGGYYSERTAEGFLLKEFGLGGKLTFDIGADEYVIGLALIAGGASHPTEDSFEYFMIHIFFRGKIPIASFELMSIQVLFAWNMQPRLEEIDREARELRYYNWYKRSDPLRASVTQMLANWTPRDDAWAFGAGASVSFAGLGSLMELSLFVMGMDGPDEAGLLAALELFMLGSKKPIGYAVLEVDTRNDRFALMLGVDIKVSNFVEDPPEWLDNIVKISGTLFAGNDPGTVALGRLSDERTWFGIELEYDIWVAKVHFRFALCFEWVDGEIIGFGIVIRLEGGSNMGVIGFHFNLGLGILVAWFQTGSSDYAVAIFIEGGLRIVLFGFIRFGISARLDFRVVGNDPSRIELTGRFRLETPWFLPDVTWTIEEVWGDLRIEDLGSSAGPLRRSLISDNSKRTFPLHREGVDPNWDGEGVAPLFSVKALRQHTSSEAERLTRFAKNVKAFPIATDTTIHIEFTVALNDKVLTGDPVSSSDFGRQESGDVHLQYDFIDIQIRRKPRFGGGAWTLVDHMEEIGADFSDSDGVTLEGSFDPSNISMIWDPDVKIAGNAAPKRLLINAKTPFTFNTVNPESDEENIRNNPNWPCCPREKDRYRVYNFHKLTFRDNVPGSDILGPKPFTDSNSYWSFYRDAYVRLPKLGISLPPGSWIGHLPKLTPGIIGLAVFDEDVAYVMLRMAWYTRHGNLRVVLYDRLRNNSKTHDLNFASSDFETVTLGAPFAIRSMELQFIALPPDVEPVPVFNFGGTSLKGNRIDVDCILYLSVSDFIDRIRDMGNCGGSGGDHNPYEGRGKVSFLPNTEYEIRLTTRVSILHPSDEPDPAEVEEYIYFKTKGLPGLNAVNRVGEELEPYVSKAYQGGMGIVYREEPVAVSFTDDFYVAVPLTLRPSGTLDEHTILMEMQLLVREDVAQTQNALVTSTTTDWIVDNRDLIVIVPTPINWLQANSYSFSRGTQLRSIDPSVERLAEVTQRPEVHCGLEDPLDVSGSVLIAPPQGAIDPDDASKELWPRQTSFTASVRRKQAPLIARESFIWQDITAFDFYTDSGIGNASNWSVSEGILHASTSERQYAYFGELTWNHLEIGMAVQVSTGMAGLALSLPASGPNRGLLVLVQKSGATMRLRLYERDGGAGITLKESADLETTGGFSEDQQLILRIWAFDDILRASVGEKQIEMQRNDFREGKMALVTNGNAKFYNLSVEGLDMYHFPFVSSRFASFKDHIQSYNGVMDRLDGTEMGAAPTTSPAIVYANTRNQIQQIMTPGIDDLSRQAVFDIWQQQLSLPQKEELSNLEISRFAVGSSTAFFYLESPEPLDFSTEVEVSLQKRKRINGGWTIPEDVFENLRRFREAERIPGGIGPGSNPDLEWARHKEAMREELFKKDAIERLDEGLSPLEVPAPGAREMLSLKIDDLDIGSDTNFKSMNLSLNRDLDNERCCNLIFMEHVADGSDGPIMEFYRLEEGSELPLGSQNIQIRRTSLVLDESVQNIVHEIGNHSRPGAFYAIDVAEGLLDLYLPRYTYEDQDVVVLQDGSRRRALIIPVEGSNHKMLSTGKYRMSFEITRKRWDTTEAMDNWNTYNQEASLSFHI